MRKLLAMSFLLLALTVSGKEINVKSPDGKLVVTVDDEQGLLTYRVSYMGQTMLKPSALGLKTDIGDFTRGMTFKEMKGSNIDKTYTMTYDPSDFLIDATGMRSLVEFMGDELNLADTQKIKKNRNTFIIGGSFTISF